MSDPRHDTLLPSTWVAAMVVFAGVALITVSLLLFPPVKAADYVVPREVTSPDPRLSYTPFTRVPREPHPSTVYYPPGFTPQGR